MAATDTIPSLAPSTPARSQFSRAAMPVLCGSSSCRLLPAVEESGWLPMIPREALFSGGFQRGKPILPTLKKRHRGAQDRGSRAVSRVVRLQVVPGGDALRCSFPHICFEQKDRITR
jgi:hypothetical protein